MNAAARKVQRVFLVLTLLQTLAASFIWGINTLFLLDAGLSNTEAFTANAFFAGGLVLFEIPTGVVADTKGRRMSFLLGTAVLAVSTLAYLGMWRMHAPFWGWALTSMLLGFGFTFFSGATEAWLVDALEHSGYFAEKGELERVLAKGEIVEGCAMLGGSIAGGAIAQLTNLGVPYVLRTITLVLTFAIAFVSMKDLGFSPAHGTRPLAAVKTVLRDSLHHGLGNPPVRWLMLAAPFTGGVSLYAFYAMQPYLLELWGDERAYGIAGLAAAIVAGAQIVGGLAVPLVRRAFRRRTTVVFLGTLGGASVLVLVGLVPVFAWVVAGLVFWALLFATVTPVRQAYLNAQIPSKQRATVLSFDNLLGSAGGVALQPVLGRAADLWSYPVSYAISGGIQALALPFVLFARRARSPADAIPRKIDAA